MLRRAMMAEGGGGPVTFAEAIAADNPYLWWRLGEASGTTAADNSGNARPGTYNGTAGTAYDLGEPGLVGDANTSVEIKSNAGWIRSNAEHPLANSGEGATIVLAIKVGIGAAAGALLTKHSEPSPGIVGGSRDPWLFIGADGTLGAAFWSGAMSIITSPSPVNDGVARLVHFRIGADSTEGAQLYIDGAMIDSISASPTTTYDGFVTAGYNNLNGWGIADAAALGVLDEVVVFNARLSEARIAAHASAAGY